MSFELCKRITLNPKKNIIKVCIASNNVFPKTYTTCELCNSNSDRYKNYTFEDKLLCLYEDMQSGNIQISTINDNTEKFEYAMCKVREYHKQNNIDSFNDLYEQRGKVYREKIFGFAKIERSQDEDLWKAESEDYKKYYEWQKTQDKDFVKDMENKFSLEAVKEIYGESFKVWKQALEEEIKGEYKVLFDNYYVVTKLGKYDRGYGKFFYANKEYSGFEKMSFKKAYIFTKDRADRNLQIVEVV